MKYFMVILLTLALLAGNSPYASAADKPSGRRPLPQVTGEAAYLIDVQSGQVLYSKNPDEQLAPASTTKIMTGLLALEKGNLDDVVTASDTLLDNNLVYGTQIYLTPGEKMTLRDLLYAMFLNSANDAAVTIAEHIGGNVDNFVAMMNQRAQEIGATDTHFVNPSGLTAKGHVTTAHDLALIARVAYQNPLFDQYVKTKTQAVTRDKSSKDVPTTMVNENKMLWQDPQVDGIKTGYTSEAENCLVASITRNGRQMIGVILKSPGREIYTDMESMFDYGYSEYSDAILKPAGSVLSTMNVNDQSVGLRIDSPIYVTQDVNDQAIPAISLKTQVGKYDSVEEGQEVGSVEVYDGDALLDTLPLKASRTVSLSGFTQTDSHDNRTWLWGIGTAVLFLALLYLRKLNSERKARKRILVARRRESN